MALRNGQFDLALPPPSMGAGHGGPRPLVNRKSLRVRPQAGASGDLRLYVVV